MVGRDVIFDELRQQHEMGEEKLRVEGLCALNDRMLPALRQVSLSVRAGEIVGVCGVEGNGQTELVNALTGLSPASGSIRVNGAELCRAGVRARREHRMSHIPEDRMKVGGAKTCSITENLMLDSYYTPDYCRGGVLDYPRMNAHAGELIERFAVKVPNGEYPLGTLSGGNIQKVILARELEGSPDLLVAVHPTRGLDIGATRFVHDTMIEARDKGCGVLLISADFDEILEVSDRIVVMFEGQIMGVFSGKNPPIEEISLAMAGK